MTTALRPGVMVHGYEVVRLVGSGGMGEVWEAREAGRSARLALKVSHAWEDEGLRRRLELEGRVALGLDHPNLVPVLDVVTLGSSVGLVMPLVEGPSLELLRRHQSLEEHDALVLLRGVVAGVAHLHARGLVHRDLKPANILLEARDGTLVPRVSDLGLVRIPAVESGDTRSGAALGTPAYAAPEQLRDASTVDLRADLWSLGVILVELCAGHRPFPGHTAVAVAEAQLAEPSLHGLSPRLTGLARRLLQLDPAARPASAAVLLQELDLLCPNPSTRPALLRAVSTLGTRAGDTTPGIPSSEAGTSPYEAFGSTGPTEAAPFVGRVRELRAIDRAFRAGTRLVTVVGPPGRGTTRLVGRFATTWGRDFPGGLARIDGRDADTPALFGLAVATGLGLGPGEGATEGLARRGPCLLVLDTGDATPDGDAPLRGLLAEWLQAAPRACILVAGTAPTGARSEQVIPLGPLQPGEAVTLYQARRRVLHPSRRPEAATLGAIDTLVDRVAGEPLAVELLASCPTEPIALAADLPTVAGAPPLEAALRLIDAQLDDGTRRSLSYLATLRGGCSFEIAEALLDGTETWPLDQLQSLTERALARLEPAERIGIHPVIARWAVSGGSEEAERRHGEVFAELAARVLEGELPQISLALEIGNLIVAGRRALARGDDAVAESVTRAAAAVLGAKWPEGAVDQLLAELLAIGGPGSSKADFSPPEQPPLGGPKRSGYNNM